MESSEVARWYPTRIDAWLAVVLVIAPLTCLAASTVTPTVSEALLVALGGGGLFAAIYLGLVFPMRYGITHDALVIRHGLVRQRVPLRDIISVRPTRNPLSSPALSLDRLQIRFGEGLFGSVMISPKEKAAFMAELCTRAGLHLVGDAWVRG